MSPYSLRLTPRSSCSFTCTDVEAFGIWLQAHSFTPIPTRHTLTEYGRWTRSRRIIVAYHSGSVLVQGLQIAPCLALLNELVEESAVLR